MNYFNDCKSTLNLLNESILLDTVKGIFRYLKMTLIMLQIGLFNQCHSVKVTILPKPR